jgi:L-fucose isomerase-like protein
MEQLRVGFVACYQTNFNIALIEKGIRKSIEVLERLSGQQSFQFFPIREGVYDIEGAAKARNRVREDRIDLLLIQNASFAAGDIIRSLANCTSHLCLWAVPEPTEEGPLPLNSFCGTTMYASIIGNYLTDAHIRFKWLYGDADSKIFLSRLKLTIRALTALKALAGSRLALVGHIAPGFYDLCFDERELTAKFGLSVCRHDFDEVLKRATGYDDTIAKRLAETIAHEGNNKGIDYPQFEKASRVYLALEDIAKENEYGALAIDCWPSFQQEYGFCVCSTIGRLNENGIVASCEGDVPGSLSMLLLNLLTRQPSTLMDLATFDVEDNSLLMWHCGPTAACWADARGMDYSPHFIHRMGIVNDLTLAPGEVSIIGQGKDLSKVLLAEGEVVAQAKKGFSGSRGWIHNLRIRHQSASSLDFVNTLLSHRLQHHLAVARGNLYEELREVFAWLGIDPIYSVPYSNFLENVESHL